MKRVYTIVLCIVLLFIGVVVLSPEAHAQKLLEGLTETGQEAFKPTGSYRLPFSDKEYTPQTPRSPLTIFALLVNGLFGLLGIIFLVLIISGGIQYMFSGGGDKAIKARKTLVNAAIGLVVVLGAYSLSYFILRRVEFAVKGPRTLQVGGTQGETIELPEEVNIRGGL